MKTETDSPSVVMTHRVKPGCEWQYEVWLHEITPALRDFVHNREFRVVRPPDGKGVFSIEMRFDSEKRFQEWLVSGAREHFLNRIAPIALNDG